MPGKRQRGGRRSHLSSGAKVPKLDVGNDDDDGGAKETNSTFDLLPNEILVRVFSLVDMADPANFGLLQVNRRLRRVCSSAITRLTLMTNSRMSTSMARTLLSLSPRLKSLDVEHSRDKDKIPLATHALRHCPDLEELLLLSVSFLFSESRRAKSTQDLLGTISEFGRSLRRIQLGNADFSSKTTSSPTDTAKALGGLESIELDKNCRGVDNALLDAFGRHCKKLTKLHVNSPTGEVEDIQRSVLAGMEDRIEDLRLRCLRLSSEFFVGLGRCLNLRRLAFDIFRGIDRGGLLSISTLPNLERLSLYGSTGQLSGEDFVSAFEGKKLSKLSGLNLKWCAKLDDRALGVISENCPDLQSLDVGRCPDAGARQVLVRCGNLEELCMNNLVSSTVFQDVGRNLRCLALVDAKTLDRGGLESISSLPRLQDLTLMLAHRLSEQDFMDAFDWEKLTRLTLSHCQRLDDAALGVIAEKSLHLASLNLTDCKMLTDLGIRSVVVNCGRRKLEELNLMLLPRVTGTSVFQDGKEYMPRLRRLQLRYCGIAHEQKKAIRKSFQKTSYVVLVP